LVRFGLVFIKKIIKPFKKNQNQTETGLKQPVSVRFSYFRIKTGSTKFLFLILFKIIFFMFSDRFNVLISKIIFKK
jgi:hypothetical protein